MFGKHCLRIKYSRVRDSTGVESSSVWNSLEGALKGTYESSGKGGGEREGKEGNEVVEDGKSEGIGGEGEEDKVGFETVGVFERVICPG